jgi:hypothetical protein
MPKTFSKIYILLIIVIILAGGILAWQQGWIGKTTTPSPTPTPTPVATPTPTPNPNETANWNTYTNTQYGFEFKYPEKLNTQYVNLYSSPPTITISSINQNFSCQNNQNLKTAFGYGKRESITINGNNYCITTGTAGTAGISYTTYQYVTNRNNKQLTLEFILSLVSCGAVNEMSKCETEQKDFNPNILADQILSTFRFLDETANWKTYRNDNLGFEIKYPDGWEVQDSGFNNPSCDVNRFAGVNCLISFYIEQNNSLIPIDKWIDDNLNLLYFPRNKEIIDVDGVEGRSAEATLVHVYAGHIIVFMKDKIIYEFVTGEGAYPTLLKMLSTFKFLTKENSKTESKVAKLISFEISPSCMGDAGWILYPKGAKAIAKGENLSKVEFWITPTGTQMADSLYNESQVVKNDNQWEAVLPEILYVVDLYAIGYDSNGNKVGKISIGSNIYGSDNTSKYPDNCK